MLKVLDETKWHRLVQISYPGSPNNLDVFLVEEKKRTNSRYLKEGTWSLLYSSNSEVDAELCFYEISGKGGYGLPSSARPPADTDKLVISAGFNFNETPWMIKPWDQFKDNLNEGYVILDANGVKLAEVTRMPPKVLAHLALMLHAPEMFVMLMSKFSQDEDVQELMREIKMTQYATGDRWENQR